MSRTAAIVICLISSVVLCSSIVFSRASTPEPHAFEREVLPPIDHEQNADAESRARIATLENRLKEILAHECGAVLLGRALSSAASDASVALTRLDVDPDSSRVSLQASASPHNLVRFLLACDCLLFDSAARLERLSVASGEAESITATLVVIAPDSVSIGGPDEPRLQTASRSETAKMVARWPQTSVATSAGRFRTDRNASGDGLGTTRTAPEDAPLISLEFVGELRVGGRDSYAFRAEGGLIVTLERERFRSGLRVADASMHTITVESEGGTRATIVR